MKVEFKNKPNFQIESVSGEQYWISRSVAVVVVPLFMMGNEVYIPLGKRSDSMTLYPGHWGIPCGFLDWGEDAAQCVRREVWEEIGIDLQDYCTIPSQPNLVISEPNPKENQTVSLRFIVNCYVDELPELKASQEVTEARWLELDSEENWKRDKESLAFNHAEIIEWAWLGNG